MLLDEPLANLDYKLREELREELPSILQEAGAILVYATAEPLEALLLGGVTATLSEGRMIQCGSTPQVYHRPSHIGLGARIFRSAAQRDSQPPSRAACFVSAEISPRRPSASLAKVC